MQQHCLLPRLRGDCTSAEGRVAAATHALRMDDREHASRIEQRALGNYRSLHIASPILGVNLPHRVPNDARTARRCHGGPFCAVI
jgi:hypothetical protein